MMRDEATSTQGGRIRLAIQVSPFNLTVTAERAGLSKQALSDITNNHAQGDRHLPLLAQILHVPEEWLRDGGELPDSIAKALGVQGAHPELNSDVQAFFSIMDSGITAWEKLKIKNPNRYNEALATLSLNVRQAVTLRALPVPVDEPVSELIKMLAVVGITFATSSDLERFTAGHADYAAAIEDFNAGFLPRPRRQKRIQDLSLPPKIFSVVRGALKVLLAERQAFDRPTREIDAALRLLWERQFTQHLNPGTRAALERQRRDDLERDQEPS